MCDNVYWCAVRSQMVQCNMYSVHVVWCVECVFEHALPQEYNLEK